MFVLKKRKKKERAGSFKFINNVIFVVVGLVFCQSSALPTFLECIFNISFGCFRIWIVPI